MSSTKKQKKNTIFSVIIIICLLGILACVGKIVYTKYNHKLLNYTNYKQSLDKESDVTLEFTETVAATSLLGGKRCYIVRVDVEDYKTVAVIVDADKVSEYEPKMYSKDILKKIEGHTVYAEDNEYRQAVARLYLASNINNGYYARANYYIYDSSISVTLYVAIAVVLAIAIVAIFLFVGNPFARRVRPIIDLKASPDAEPSWVF